MEESADLFKVCPLAVRVKLTCLPRRRNHLYLPTQQGCARHTHDRVPVRCTHAHAMALHPHIMPAASTSRPLETTNATG